MKTKFLFYAIVLSALVGCDGNNKVDKQQQGLKPETSEHRLTVMPEYNYKDSVVAGGHTYIYTMHREADDSLKIVVDENGEKYADNFYTLGVNKDGHRIFSHKFTKASFGQYLDSGFKQNGILDGFRFIEVKEGTVIFGACISYPDSDMSSPFVVTVCPDGSYSIRPDNIMDVDEPDDSDGV